MHGSKRKPFVWLILLLILPILIRLIYKSDLPMDVKQNNAAFVTVGYLYFLIPFTLFVLWLRKVTLERQKQRTPIILLGMAIWVAGLIFGLARFEYQASAAMLPQMQDYLVEAAAVKLKGDSINAGHPVKNTNWTSINSSAETASKGLNNFLTSSLARKMNGYKTVGINWSNEISAAAKNTKTWKNLPSQPADFELSLNDSVARDWLKASLQNIYLLKEFGDEAIKRKDKETMYYISAKLLVQKHWLNGILHSQKTNPLGVKLINPVLAVSNADSKHPCYGVFLNCMGATCAGNINCEAICSQKFDACAATTPAKQPVKQAPPAKQTAPAQKQTQPAASPTILPSPKPIYTYTAAVRDTCIKIRTGSYCAEGTIQSVNEIAASAIGFAEGEAKAEEKWNEAWHELEAIGEVLESEPTEATAEHSPRVQAFFNSCEARGSFVGGANQDKGRLPTTESGYHCNYKEGTNNCWDFLTYSGGRYMGGDVGCREKNLRPL